MSYTVYRDTETGIKTIHTFHEFDAKTRARALIKQLKALEPGHYWLTKN